jgi:hypothetical protein
MPFLRGGSAARNALEAEIESRKASREFAA